MRITFFKNSIRAKEEASLAKKNPFQQRRYGPCRSESFCVRSDVLENGRCFEPGIGFYETVRGQFFRTVNL